MPELPEVETIKNVLKNIVNGHKITKIDILYKPTILTDINDFVSKLTNQTFLDVTRIGKYLFFHLTNNLVLISHLRMEGKYYEVNENERNTYFSRVVFHLDNNHKLCYDDSRCFGIMILSDEANFMKEKEVAKLGPEPFDIKDVNYLITSTKNKRLPIKTTLLDQSLMCGIGNIYADETLYASGIHPWTPTNLISREEWERILSNACRILKEAINKGGSTIKSYHPGKGIDGNFQTSLKVYGKANQTCPICHHTFRFTKTNGRGTTFCPYCQQKRGTPLNIGLTGIAGSGKSTALKMFKEVGWKVISADEIVNQLYKDEKIVNQLNKILKTNVGTSCVDKDLLRKHLILHKEDISKVNRFVHPLVEQQIDTAIKFNKNEVIIFEVPLLFESHMDEKFDTIIAIGISKEVQKLRLQERNVKTSDAIEEINKNNHFEQYKNKATYLVYNDGSLEDYIKQINEIIYKVKDHLN